MVQLTETAVDPQVSPKEKQVESQIGSMEPPTAEEWEWCMERQRAYQYQAKWQTKGESSQEQARGYLNLG